MYFYGTDEALRISDGREIDEQTVGGNPLEDTLAAREFVVRGNALFYKVDANYNHGLSQLDLAFSLADERHGECFRLKTSLSKPANLEGWYQTIIGGKQLWARKVSLPSRAQTDEFVDSLSGERLLSYLRSYQAMTPLELKQQILHDSRGSRFIDGSAFHISGEPVIDLAGEPDLNEALASFAEYDKAKLLGKTPPEKAVEHLRELKACLSQMTLSDAKYHIKCRLSAIRRQEAILGLNPLGDNPLESRSAAPEQPRAWGFPHQVHEALASKNPRAAWKELSAKGWPEYSHGIDPSRVAPEKRNEVIKSGRWVMPTRDYLIKFAADCEVDLRPHFSNSDDGHLPPSLNELASAVHAVQLDYFKALQEWQEETDASRLWTNLAYLQEQLTTVPAADIRPKPSMATVEPNLAGFLNPSSLYIQSRLAAVSTPEERTMWAGDTGPLVNELCYLDKVLASGGRAQVGHPLAKEIHELYEITKTVNTEGVSSVTMIRIHPGTKTFMVEGKRGLVQAVMIGASSRDSFQDHLQAGGYFGIFLDQEVDLSRPAWHKVKVTTLASDDEDSTYTHRFLTKVKDKWTLIDKKDPLLDLFKDDDEGVPPLMRFISRAHHAAETLAMTKVYFLNKKGRLPVLARGYARDVFPKLTSWAFHVADLWASREGRVSDFYDGDKDLMQEAWAELSAFQRRALKLLEDVNIREHFGELVAYTRTIMEEVLLDPSLVQGAHYFNEWGEPATPYGAIFGKDGAGRLYAALSKLQGRNSAILLPKEASTAPAKMMLALGYKSCSDYRVRDARYFTSMVMDGIYRNASIDQRRWTLRDGSTKWMPPLYRWANWTKSRPFSEMAVAFDANPLNFGCGRIGDMATKLLNILYPPSLPGLKELTRPSREAFTRELDASARAGRHWNLDNALRIHAAELLKGRHPSSILQAMRVAVNWGGIRYLSGRDNQLTERALVQALFPAPSRGNIYMHLPFVDLVAEEADEIVDDAAWAAMVKKRELFHDADWNDLLWDSKLRRLKAERQRIRLGRAMLTAFDQRMAMQVVRLHFRLRAAWDPQLSKKLGSILAAHSSNLGDLPQQLKLV